MRGTAHSLDYCPDCTPGVKKPGARRESGHFCRKFTLWLASSEQDREKESTEIGPFHHIQPPAPSPKSHRQHSALCPTDKRQEGIVLTCYWCSKNKNFIVTFPQKQGWGVWQSIFWRKNTLIRFWIARTCKKHANMQHLANIGNLELVWHTEKC